MKVVLSEDPWEKVVYTYAAYNIWKDQDDNGEDWEPKIGDFNHWNFKKPRMSFLKYLPSNKMPKIGKGGTLESRAKMLHALCHAEVGAVDLTWDLIMRNWRLQPYGYE